MSRRLARIGVYLLSWPLRAIEALEAKINRESCTAAPTARFLPGCLVRNLGNRDLIKVGDHTLIRGRLQVLSPEAKISIGSYCYVGDDSWIWCAAGITIGDRVLISHNVNIHDTNGHSISASMRHQQTRVIFSGHDMDPLIDVLSSPIVIEDDVWIGFNSMILAGVTIGKGAIIGAGSRVTRNVPPYAIILGAPQRQVGVALQ